MKKEVWVTEHFGKEKRKRESRREKRENERKRKKKERKEGRKKIPTLEKLYILQIYQG